MQFILCARRRSARFREGASGYYGLRGTNRVLVVRVARFVEFTEDTVAKGRASFAAR